MQPLANKVAVVTGASKGIGRAIAIRLAADGASVVLTARSESGLNETASLITSTGGNALVVAADLRTPESATAIVDQTITNFGGLDVLVNNAGATKRGHFLSLTDAEMFDGFALKYFGATRLTQRAWPHLKQRSGSVIFISGIGGRTPGAEFTIGGPVNAALLSLTKALADLGIDDGVQVNAINPGPIRTDRLQTRLKMLAADRGVTVGEAEGLFLRESKIAQVGEPEDIAALVAFLSGPEGRLMHGAIIDADGGFTKSL